MYLITAAIDAMGRPRHLIPALTLHRPSGQGRVYWNGRYYYLGKWGSDDLAVNYRRIVSNVIATGKPVVDEPPRPTIRQLSERYLDHVRDSFPKSSGEPAAIARAIRELNMIAGDFPPEYLTPPRFLELRTIWVKRPLVISTINKYHNYILGMFAWLATMLLIPPSVWHSLQTVKKLKPNRSSAKDPKIVEPVPWNHVLAIKDHVSPTVWNLIQLQYLTGMRSGEVLGMTLEQIENEVYSPVKHKNAWRKHKRNVSLGPRAREIIRIASEGKAEDELIFPGYTNASYGRAISRACQKAGIPKWHPHQLRHAAGDRVREAYGLDVTQAFLGHATAKMSERYAKVKPGQAKLATDEIG